MSIPSKQSFKILQKLYNKLKNVKHKYLKGWELKENIYTIHCINRIPEIEKIATTEETYCLWNGEAYDIGIKNYQNKGEGLKAWSLLNGYNKSEILAIGDNYNDIELLNNAGLKISADKTRLQGDFYIELNYFNLPGLILSKKLLELQK